MFYKQIMGNKCEVWYVVVLMTVYAKVDLSLYFYKLCYDQFDQKSTIKRLFQIKMNGSYTVQTIIDRKVFSGKVLYKIKWKGLDQNYATWQSVKMLKNYRDLIKQFAHNIRHKKMAKNEQLYFDDQKDQHTLTQKNMENLDKVLPQIKLEREQQNKEKDQEKVKLNELPPIEIEDIVSNIKPQQKEKKIEEEKQQVIPPPKVPKRRGRPPKKLTAHLNQAKIDQEIKTKALLTEETKMNEGTDIKTTEGLSDTVKRYLKWQNNKQQQVFHLAIQSLPTLHVNKVDKQTNTIPDNSPKEIIQQQIKIFFFQPAAEGIQYTISQGDGTFKKYTSQAMLQRYPSQLTKFLQQSLLEQTKTTNSNPLF